MLKAAGRYVIGPAVSRVFGGLFGHPVDVSNGRKLLLASDELDFVQGRRLNRCAQVRRTGR